VCGRYRPGPILNIFVANQLATQLAAREFERAGLEARWVAILELALPRLARGKHRVTIVAVDRAGNRSRAARRSFRRP
jgi:hypothetical protein